MNRILLLLVLAGLTACASMLDNKDERMEIESAGHLDGKAPPAANTDIPPVVQQVPIIAAPEPAEPLQTFTVVATDLPASELLFALARDARLNLDIDPAITGRVSINAIDQTMPQILQRISRQVALRYYLDGPNLVVELNRPFTRTYRIDYLNMSRSTKSSIGIETALVAGEQGSTGDSSTQVENDSNNDFWATLEANLAQLATRDGVDSSVISNRESGTVSVRTIAAAHEDIQRFIDQVINSAPQAGADRGDRGRSDAKRRISGRRRLVPDRQWQWMELRAEPVGGDHDPASRPGGVPRTGGRGHLYG